MTVEQLKDLAERIDQFMYNNNPQEYMSDYYAQIHKNEKSIDGDGYIMAKNHNIQKIYEDLEAGNINIYREKLEKYAENLYINAAEMERDLFAGAEEEEDVNKAIDKYNEVNDTLNKLRELSEDREKSNKEGLDKAQTDKLEFTWEDGNLNDNAKQIFKENHIDFHYDHFGNLEADFDGTGYYQKVNYINLGDNTFRVVAGKEGEFQNPLGELCSDKTSVFDADKLIPDAKDKQAQDWEAAVEEALEAAQVPEPDFEMEM